MLLVVALAAQVAWVLARCAGEAIFGRSGYLAGLEFGVWLASMIVAALAMLELASRLSSTRKVGVLLAAGAFTMCAGSVIGVEIGWRVGWGDWMRWMYVYGWRALDIIAIAGLAVAGGKRAMWVAAPAIGLALIGLQSTPVDHSVQLWYAAMTGLRLGLLFILMQEAERFATQETSYRRLVRGFRIFEVGLWMSIGLTLARLIPALEHPTGPVLAVVTNALLIVLRLVTASGAWLIVRSRMVEVPRWPFAVALVSLLWQTARAARSWTVTLTTKWDHFETVKLTHAPWWVYLPSTIGTLCTVGSLFVLARRLQVSARMSLIAMVIIVADVALSPAGIFPDWFMIVAGAVAGLSLVLAMRVGRADLHLVHERAMHAHTFA